MSSELRRGDMTVEAGVVPKAVADEVEDGEAAVSGVEPRGAVDESGGESAAVDGAFSNTSVWL